jgi:hypothetical protein
MHERYTTTSSQKRNKKSFLNYVSLLLDIRRSTFDIGNWKLDLHIRRVGVGPWTLNPNKCPPYRVQMFNSQSPMMNYGCRTPNAQCPRNGWQKPKGAQQKKRGCPFETASLTLIRSYLLRYSGRRTTIALCIRILH